ncbi:MAG: hypothetical protein CM15mP12_7040 [Gammaproteobacteria bacterium]|nr:MAG: hypothetical protein CM15mP12_7040 [Gammaproteobacteria bacterium]
MPDKINVKVKMPMIPLRDVVIFPNTVSTLFVGREKSIFSLKGSYEQIKKYFWLHKIHHLMRSLPLRFADCRHDFNITSDDKVPRWNSKDSC